MTTLITTRLYFSDGTVELVNLLPRQAHSDRYARPIVTSRDEVNVHWRSVAFRRRDIAVPPDFIGPLESDDVIVEHDSPVRAVMARDLGEDVTRREMGPSVEGWRLVSVFVEDGAPWHRRWRHAVLGSDPVAAPWTPTAMEAL